MFNYTSCDKESIKEIAHKIADIVKMQDVICLYGDIGAGKTTFAQYLISKLLQNDKPEIITSPTFNIVHQYDGKGFTIWHFDFYRLKSIEEVYNIGFQDALSYGVSIIEWPNIVESILPKSAFKIFIDFTEDNKRRKITFNQFMLDAIQI